MAKKGERVNRIKFDGDWDALVEAMDGWATVLRCYHCCKPVGLQWSGETEELNIVCDDCQE